MSLKNIFIFIICGLLFSSLSVMASTLLNGEEITFDNSSNGMESSNVQDAIEELYLKGSLVCENEIITKVATNFYNAGVNSFVVMPVSGASAVVHAKSSGTTTKRDSQSGESDHLYLYKDPDDNYGVITAINIPIKAAKGAAYQLGTSSFTATVRLMTDTGIELDTISFTSNTDQTITWKPANYNLDEDVEYIYVSWEASGTASIVAHTNTEYNASFSFTINEVTAEYLPLN